MKKEHFPKTYGQLVSQGDTKGLLEGILAVYNQNDNELPEQMHQYISNKFSPESIAKQFSELYEKILED